MASADETAAAFQCTNVPPHRFILTGRTRNANGILITLQRLDIPYPPREIFITNREMKMGYDDVVKACFVCVDRGQKEKAVAIPKSEIEAGLPPP
ncbi:MAG: hypothetical protein ABR610_02830 [Thermoanaerobaculia bacterium]|nr:hypothetical protein [Acidobacteriota bacterium]